MTTYRVNVKRGMANCSLLLAAELGLYVMVWNNCAKFQKKIIDPFSSYYLETVGIDRRTDGITAVMTDGQTGNVSFWPLCGLLNGSSHGQIENDHTLPFVVWHTLYIKRTMAWLYIDSINFKTLKINTNVLC